MLMPDQMSLMIAEGRGKITDAHTVEVELSSGGKRTLKTKYILLAVGGKPVKAPIPGAVSCHFLLPFQSNVPPFFTRDHTAAVADAQCLAATMHMTSFMQEHAITSDDALVLDEIPGSTIVIVGAGYISVEFSSIYKGLGADVHLMYRKPLPLTGCVHPSALSLGSPGLHPTCHFRLCLQGLSAQHVWRCCEASGIVHLWIV